MPTRFATGADSSAVGLALLACAAQLRAKISWTFRPPTRHYRHGWWRRRRIRVCGAMSDIEKRNGNGDGGPSTGVVVRAKPKTKKPSMYKVLMLNDDYTPMEFVVHILERFFNKNREEATRIMLHVHRRGVGICGVYTYEVAENKVTQVMDFARQHQHPLQCTLEKD
jgi:ATP-dependent Clp protease adaptor protein ClpS